MGVDRREAELPVPIGSVIADKYRVEEVLGVGGFGIVAVGRHIKLDQKFAIKMLLPSAMKDAELVARFAREARAVARISSEHVAKVADVGETENGTPFMVMEYLEGADLERVFRKRGPLPPAEAVDYVLQACEALAEAHREGIVHRDLKPANLFITKRADGTALVKVLDFGISKLRGGAPIDSATLTDSEIIIGSPRYMSPEHLRSARDVDARTDIWALGAVLYHLISGVPPFNGSSTAETSVAVFKTHPEALSVVRKDVPRALSDAVDRCLQKEADARYSSIAELAEALGPVATDEGRASVVSILRIAGLEGATRKETKSTSMPEALLASERSLKLPLAHASWLPIAIGIGIGLAVVATIGIVTTSVRGGPTPTQPIGAATAAPSAIGTVPPPAESASSDVPTANEESIAAPSAEPAPVPTPTVRARPAPRPSAAPSASADGFSEFGRRK